MPINLIEENHGDNIMIITLHHKNKTKTVDLTTQTIPQINNITTFVCGNLHKLRTRFHNPHVIPVKSAVKLTQQINNNLHILITVSEIINLVL